MLFISFYYTKTVFVFDKYQTLENQLLHILRKLLVEESYFSTG